VANGLEIVQPRSGIHFFLENFENIVWNIDQQSITNIPALDIELWRISSGMKTRLRILGYTVNTTLGFFVCFKQRNFQNNYGINHINIRILICPPLIGQRIRISLPCAQQEVFSRSGMRRHWWKATYSGSTLEVCLG
jgi:hypothetical protein